MSATIKLEHLSKIYGSKAAVDDVTEDFYAGQVVALLGENGAGKSTLLNMIAGFITPSEGKIIINNNDLAVQMEEVKRNIGFLPEGSPLYEDMRVKDFLMYMADLKGVECNQVTDVLKLAYLEDVSENKIETLSKGYRRRVGFAVSQLGNPMILLLDEPTDGLDPNQKAHLLGLIQSMGQEKTIIISTHLLDEAQMIASRILIMHKGQIKIDGDLEMILKRTQTNSLENAFIKLTR